MTVLPELRDSLMEAARRQAFAPAPAPVRRVRRLARGFPVLLAAALAGLVAYVAVTELHHRPASRAPAATSVPGRQQLIDILAPLRRPQTPADLKLRMLSRRGSMSFGLLNGSIDLPLVRYAATTPWGERMFIVPMKPPTAKQLAAAKRRFPNGRRFLSQRVSQGETAGLFSNGGGGCCSSAAMLEAHGSGTEEGAGRSFAGGSTRERDIALVPDGVAKVEFVFPRQPDGNQYGGPVYRHVLKVTVPVHDNIAAVQVDRECCSGQASVWYDAAGHVIRTLGNPAAAGRVVATPIPGPETPLSRAAERDPSTPNPVWVTPGVGGPHTKFHIHFHVLLNGADYSYRFTGTRCRRFTFPGGTGDPNALRGSLWSDGVGAVQGQALCPGTYHVSVSVMGFLRSSGPRYPRRPFGSATFTVR